MKISLIILPLKSKQSHLRVLGTSQTSERCLEGQTFGAVSSVKWTTLFSVCVTLAFMMKVYLEIRKGDFIFCRK